MRFCLLALALALPAAAEVTVRSYDVPGAGTLELEVPMRWREEVGWTDGDHRTKVAFRPDEGEAFALTITVLPPPENVPGPEALLEWLRGIVEGSARASLGLPEDAALGLEQIGDARAVGWYYSVTDSALPDPAPPGTFRVMTQGASAAGPVVLSATLLTQRASGVEMSEALRVLSTARLSDRPSDAWRRPGDDVLLGRPFDLALPPDFELRSSSPFVARDRETGGLLSVNVRRETGRQSVRDELRRLEHDMQRRSPDAWITRRREPALLAGRAAARLVALDELRDESVTALAMPLDDAVIELTWRVDPRQERAGEKRLEAALAGLSLKE